MNDALTYCTDDGQFEIEGQTAGFIAMKCPAWALLDLNELHEYADRSGRDRRLPRGSIRAFRRRPTSKLLSMPFVITGSADVAGNPITNPQSGFKRNYRFLRDQLVTDPGTREGTRNARFIDADGDVFTGRVHVLAIPLGDGEQGRYKATLELSLVDGMLT